MRVSLLIFGLAFALPALAADPPLTLEAALAQADQPHPDIDAAQAQADLARASQMLADSRKDFSVTLSGSLASGHNPASDRYAPNNYASLDARKLLYDGGRTTLNAEAAALETAGREAQLLDARTQRRLAIMTRFFDVLMTDMQYAVDSEFSAVAYVNYDNGKDRHNVGEISSVQLAELEARYQEARVKRQEDLRQARVKRSLLANAMNRPGQLPSELAEPDIKDDKRPLPDLAVLDAALDAGNPRLQAQADLLQAAQKRLAAQRNGTYPSLDVSAGTATYSRDTLTRDDLHIGLNLNWPIWQGRQNDALVGQEQARFKLLQAQYDQLRLDLHQALRDTCETIEYLRTGARPAADVNASYRDLSLERARAEYELELKTNLGTSMAEIQAARLRSKAVDYQLALAFEKLDALLGRPLRTITVAKTEETK